MTNRDEIMWNSTHVWKPYSVPYSQSTIHQPDGYRQDCSGYVSLCFASGPRGYSTVTFVDSGAIKRINESDLQPGDAVGNCGPGTWGNNGHIQLFEKWDGNGYWCWEQTGGVGPQHNRYNGKPSARGYASWRYTGLTGPGLVGVGMSTREAQLSASWTTTGSDEHGWASGFPEAGHVARHANRQMEARLNERIDRGIQLASTWITTGSDENGWTEGYPESDSVKHYALRQVEQRLSVKIDELNTQTYDLHELVRRLGQRIDSLLEGRGDTAAPASMAPEEEDDDSGHHRRRRPPRDWDWPPQRSRFPGHEHRAGYPNPRDRQYFDDRRDDDTFADTAPPA